ncbi:MAG: peptidase domain-containing ABC transporter [Solirubrobacterales bacterium]|nr:peptidase domain-containing ABC transporter [Solirubrobacterales bacterium]
MRPSDVIVSTPGTGVNATGSEALLERLPLLVPLSEPERRLVAACFEPLTFEYGETVVAQGEPPTGYFVIASGRARVLTVGLDGREVPLNMLSAGDAFGELALVEGAPRSATVRASTPLEVLRLDSRVFLALMRIHPALREAFAIDARTLLNGDFLRQHPAFAGLPRQRLVELVAGMDELSLADGALVLGAAGHPAGLYLVVGGRLAAVDADGRELFRLHAGDVCGREISVDDAGRPALRAVGEARLLVVADDALRSLVAEFPEIGARLDERAALVVSRRRGDSGMFARIGAGVAASEEKLLAEIAEEDVVGPVAVEKRRRLWRGRFAVVRQVDAMDCGAACVATLCRQYGYDVSLPAIRAAVGTGIDGTSLRGIMRGGAEIGIEFRTIKSSSDRLDGLPKPLILHWGANHWVVLHELRNGRARLADPALGLRTVSESQLTEEWSGYAAIPTPTARLADAPRGGLTLGWLVPFVRPHYRALAGAGLLALLAAALQMLLPVLTQVVIDGLLHHRGAGRASLVLGVSVLALVIAVAFTVLQRRTLAMVAVSVDGGALDYVAERLLRLPLGYFQVRRTADIQRRLEGMREIRRILVEEGVVGLTAAFQLVIAFVVMAVYSWVVGLLFLGVLPVYGLLMRYSSRRLKPAFDSLEESFGRYQSKQLDSIKGIEVVKVSGAEEGFRRILLRQFEGLQDLLYRRDLTLLVYDGLVSLATLGVVILFLWVCALLVNSGQMTIGALVAVNTLVLLAIAPLRILLALWDQLQYASVLLARLQDVHENRPEQNPKDRPHSVSELGGHVRLHRVGFHFPQTPDQQILDQISLDVPAGLTVALVGRSGSGKSTLLRCLTGLLVPTEGSIEYDGADLRSLDLRELRARIGFVLQEPYLFDATITENIAFGHEQPDPERAREAAAIANAAEFIEQLPLRYDTRVGDSGLRLSTGQAQRISIARAVYSRPSVLLMDEPTSALDTEAERAVKEGLDRLLRGRTAFVVAHRLSTIRDADLICVLDGGRLIEQGTHDELIDRQGLYAYLYSQQLAT